MRGLALVLLLGGCGGATEVAEAQMALSPSSGLSPGDIAAVEILVFDAASGGCARVLMGTSPLDDPGLVIVAHALFDIDGTPKHLEIPAKKALDFYAEAFATTAPNRMRVGRGCVDQTLDAGASTDVSISISADQ
ncbi:MAG TPA: hypothetical protein VGL86_14155 [Polyangia bacterium]|jgi:hypothetical protein